MNNVIGELSLDDLNEVSGGGVPDGYCYTDGPGGWGLYAGKGCDQPPPPPPPPPPNGGVSSGAGLKGFFQQF
jgi:hypothetical protein